MSLRKDLVITRPGFAGALRKTGTYVYIESIDMSGDTAARVNYQYRDIETHEVFSGGSFYFHPNHEAPKSIKNQAYDYMKNSLEEFHDADYAEDRPPEFGVNMADRIDRDV